MSVPMQIGLNSGCHGTRRRLEMEYHGGKAGPGTEEDPMREKELMATLLYPAVTPRLWVSVKRHC